MTKARTTKKALFASILSLFVCISMLVGTTFAWFTDSASTEINKIISGKLEIKLEYSYDCATWSNAENQTNIFDSNAKWEPGYTQVVYFRVTNIGNLDFKYYIGTNLINKVIGKTKANTDIDLTDYIKLGFISVSEKFSDRNTALDAVSDTAVNFSDMFCGEETLSVGESSTFAMVVFMPSSVGNEANHDGINVPSIDFGVSVYAAQLASESDSFDDQYDANAKYLETAEEDIVSGKDIILKSRRAKAIVPFEAAKATADKMKLTIAERANADSTSMAYDVSITNIVEGNTAVIPVSWFVGKNINITALYNSSLPMTHAETGAEKTYEYDAETGYVTVYDTDFSEIVLEYDNVAKIGDEFYSTLEGAVNAAESGDTVEICNSFSTVNTISVTKNLTVDLNGNTFTSTGNSANKKYPLVVNAGASLVLKDGNVETQYAAVTAGNLTLQNVDYVSSFSQAISPRGGVLTVDKDSSVTVTNTAATAVVLSIIGNNAGANPTVNVYGKLNCAGAYCIAGNGTQRYWGTTVNIYEGAELNAAYSAIYQPQEGVVNIYGGKLTGERSAIEIRNGALNIMGGSFTSTSDIFSFASNTSGLTAIGTAIAVSQHTSEQPISVDISGGIFNGVYALYENDAHSSADPSKDVSINITDGIFNGKVESVNDKLVLNGGTFN